MSCKLRKLAIGLAAIAAISAFTAPIAMGVPQFTHSSYPATDTGTGSVVTNLDAGSIECDLHVETHSTSASSTITVTTTKSNCTAFGGLLNATVKMEGCDELFHATEIINGQTYRSHVAITCPSEKSIKVEAGPCAFEYKAQSGLTTVKTTNLANGTLTVQPEVTGLAYHVTKDNFGCAFKANNTTHTNGTYTGDVVLSRVGGGSVSVSGS